MRPFRRGHVKAETRHAQLEREAAERRLAHATEHVIIPLRELREKNHVQELITALIQRRREDGA